jgi:hypothetical protein
LPGGQPDIEYRDIRARGGNPDHRFGDRARLTDNIEFVIGAEQVDQASAHHLVIVD